MVTLSLSHCSLTHFASTLSLQRNSHEQLTLILVKPTSCTNTLHTLLLTSAAPHHHPLTPSMMRYLPCLLSMTRYSKLYPASTWTMPPPYFLLLNSTPIVIYMDNTGAISLSVEAKNHIRSKHIDIRYHFIREYVDKGIFLLKWLPLHRNIADIFTKPLARPLFLKHVSSLSLVSR
jgi:hypothetical protein